MHSRWKWHLSGLTFPKPPIEPSPHLILPYLPLIETATITLDSCVTSLLVGYCLLGVVRTNKNTLTGAGLQAESDGCQNR